MADTLRRSGSWSDRLRGAVATAGVPLVGFAVLIAFAALVPVVYVGAERWVYYWDHATFHDLTIGLAEAFDRTVSGAGRLVARSLGNDYNLVFAAPLMPWTLTVGSSRPAFIAGLALVYLVPFALASGYLVRQLVGERRTAAFWLGAGSVALLVPAWIPVLRGYPDVGGAAMLALAAAVYLGGPLLTDWRRIVLIAALVALAPVFRRPFAYGSIALIMSMAFHILLMGYLRHRMSSTTARPAVVLSAVGLGLVVASALGGLWLLAGPFVESILTVDFRALYASYRLPTGEVLGYFWTSTGPIVWLLAGAGLLIGLRGRDIDRPGTAFVLVFGLTALSIWTLAGGQINAHYAYLFLPALAAGVAIVLHRFYRLGRPRSAPIAVAGSSLLVGLASLVVALAPSIPLPAIVAGLLPASGPPLVRTDLAELDRLVEYLRTTAAGRPIYIAASSFLFNGEILRQAEGQRFAGADPVLAVLPGPDIDSRDGYPISNLTVADVVVLARPFQHHLPAEQQDVVRAAYDAFVEGWEISRDFRLESEGFVLENAIVLSVYQRTRVSAVDVVRRTLRQVAAAVAERPGGQTDWVIAGADATGLGLSRSPDGTATFSARIGAAGATGGAGAPRTVLLSDRAGVRSVSGEVTFGDPRCPGIALVVREHRADGSSSAEQRVTRRPADPAAFEIGLSGRPYDFVTLEIARPSGTAAAGAWPADGCRIKLGSLTLASAGG